MVTFLLFIEHLIFKVLMFSDATPHQPYGWCYSLIETNENHFQQNQINNNKIIFNKIKSTTTKIFKNIFITTTHHHQT